MVKLIRQGVYYTEEGRIVKESQAFMTSDKKEKAVVRTMAYRILHAHGAETDGVLRIRFDALVADAGAAPEIAGATEGAFPVPCTIFGDGEGGMPEVAARRGGTYVPDRLAEPREYLCARSAKGGEMLLGTQNVLCGAVGAMGVCGGRDGVLGALLGQPYELRMPAVVAVFLKGKLRKGVGPTDVALELLKATAKHNFAEGKVLEFIGAGVGNLSIDFRKAIDFAAARTGCLTTVWTTDDKTRDYFAEHGREGDFAELHPDRPAFYDGAVVIDLSRVEPMFAFGFWLKNAITLRDLLADPAAYLFRAEAEARKSDPAFTLENAVENGGVRAVRGVIAGGYEELASAAEILRGGGTGPHFSLAALPASAPVLRALAEGGYLAALLDAGASLLPAAPLGAGLAICNLPENEGAAIMDAFSVAATAKAGGMLTSALGLEGAKRLKKCKFADMGYENRIYRGE